MLNKVQIIGRITHDLKKEYLQVKGASIPKIDFQIAVNNEKDKVQFLPCVVFRTQAENCYKYLHKGSLIYLEGIITINQYTNKEGEKRFATKIIGNRVVFLDSKPKENKEPNDDMELHNTYAHFQSYQKK